MSLRVLYIAVRHTTSRRRRHPFPEVRRGRMTGDHPTRSCHQRRRQPIRVGAEVSSMDRQGSFVMTTTKLLVLVVGVGLWLTACKMGPDYARPETPTTEGWRLAPATSESLANLPWWELLKDQELQKLIRASLEENLDL